MRRVTKCADAACCKRHPRLCTDASATVAAAPHGSQVLPPSAALVPLSSDVDATWRPLLSTRPTRAKAALIYLQIGAAWPPWTPFIVNAAASNGPVLDFYFLGPPLDLSRCVNCVHLPLDEHAMLERVARFLGLPRGAVVLDERGRKLCDMKPMWAALFPELTARHEFIGYSDHDILLGNLASEVRRLSDEDDMLTPLAWFPQPLTNGNLLLVRTVPKMVHAFRRSPVWRDALRQRSIWVFDEHWGTAAGLQSGSGGSMHHVYHAMLLGGELRVRPTSKILVQDIVFIPGKRHKGLYPTISSFGASAALSWEAGRLVARRDGPCVCSAQIWDLDLGGCAECMTQPGRVHTAIRVRRTVEVVGFHFQVFKSHWKTKSRKPSTLADFVPPGGCGQRNASAPFGLDLGAGFRCAGGASL